MSISDLTDLIDDLVPDTSGRITAEKSRRALDAAVAQLSKDRPRLVVADVTVSGSGNELALPEGWRPDLSRVLDLETPVGAMPPSLIDATGWLVATTPAGDVLRLAAPLTPGEVVRIHYTAAHVLSGVQDTIPEAQREAVAHWAAALLCDQLAVAYAANSEPTIAADRTDQGAPSRAWAKQAGVYRQRYHELLGVNPGAVEPAGAVVNLDNTDSRGYRRQIHWRG